MAVRTASGDGNWSEAATWGGEDPPVAGDTAAIGAFNITLDADATAAAITHTTGTLVVPAAATVVITANITLSGSGTLLSIASGKTVTINGNVTGGATPFGGIYVDAGVLTINGNLTANASGKIGVVVTGAAGQFTLNGTLTTNTNGTGVQIASTGVFVLNGSVVHTNGIPVQHTAGTFTFNATAGRSFTTGGAVLVDETYADNGVVGG